MTKREETAEQASAFETYYAMGSDRSLAKLQKHFVTSASETQPSLRTLQNWSGWFHWQERVAIKDKAIAEGVDKKTTKDSVNRRAKWLSQAEDRMNTAFNKDGTPKFDVEDNKTLNEIVKLALTLLGEPERKEVEHLHEHEIKIIEVKELKRDD